MQALEGGDEDGVHKVDAEGAGGKLLYNGAELFRQLFKAQAQSEDEGGYKLHGQAELVIIPVAGLADADGVAPVEPCKKQRCRKGKGAQQGKLSLAEPRLIKPVAKEHTQKIF